MTYAVTWKLTAIQQLARLIASDPNPPTVERAAASVDHVLRRDPAGQGESRTPGFRLWYGDALGVYYHVDEVTRRVEVLLVGPARRP